MKFNLLKISSNFPQKNLTNAYLVQNNNVKFLKLNSNLNFSKINAKNINEILILKPKEIVSSNPIGIYGAPIKKIISNLKQIKNFCFLVLNSQTNSKIFILSKNKSNLNESFLKAFSKIEKINKNCIYGIDIANLETSLVKLLISNNLKIATAESCTGGLISSKIVSVEGSSQCFNGGIVCYSNNSKINSLNVLKSTINEFGAVSMQTAKQMAINVKKIFKAEIGISSTGIAGPSGGSKLKQVGLVYIGIAFLNNVKVFKINFTEKMSRNAIRNNSALFAINAARILINQQKIN